MKSFFAISYGNGFKKSIDVYQVKKNKLNFILDFVINTQSFKGYESAVMNKLAEFGHLPKTFRDGYYLQSGGNFYIDVRKV